MHRLAPALASRAARASVTTAPSTQPPDTDPATSPSSLTAIVAPASRGPEPSTPTTRASATRRPSRRQRSTWLMTSLTGASPLSAYSLSKPVSASMEASEWPSTKSSMYGSAAAIPRASGA